jgi:NitT/TauT family transport system substrate-binding protein
LVKAINNAFKECISKVDACIDNLANNEPLLNKDIEKRRLLYVLKSSIMTPETYELGLGDIKDTRMNSAISQIGQSYDLQRLPSVNEVFSRIALPPKADRTVAIKFN